MKKSMLVNAALAVEVFLVWFLIGFMVAVSGDRDASAPDPILKVVPATEVAQAMGVDFYNIYEPVSRMIEESWGSGYTEDYQLKPFAEHDLWSYLPFFIFLALLGNVLLCTASYKKWWGCLHLFINVLLYLYLISAVFLGAEYVSIDGENNECAGKIGVLIMLVIMGLVCPWLYAKNKEASI